MQKTLVDSGPLIALFDHSDKHHTRIVDFLKDYPGVLVSTWQVATEVCHLLNFSVNAQLDFLRWIQRGGLTLDNFAETAISRIVEMTDKYRDRPMDLADASLVVLSAQTGIRDILTLDSDFDIYRLPDKSRLRNVLAE